MRRRRPRSARLRNGRRLTSTAGSGLRRFSWTAGGLGSWGAGGLGRETYNTDIAWEPTTRTPSGYRSVVVCETKRGARLVRCFVHFPFKNRCLFYKTGTPLHFVPHYEHAVYSDVRVCETRGRTTAHIVPPTQNLHEVWHSIQTCYIICLYLEVRFPGGTRWRR